MSEMITLSAKTRTADFGSAGSRRLLRAGYIPAVIYGKQAPAHCAVVAKEFLMKKHHFTGSTIITLDVEGQKHMVFVKTFQENLLKGIVNHIDFYEVTAGEKVRTPAAFWSRSCMRSTSSVCPRICLPSSRSTCPLWILTMPCVLHRSSSRTA